MGNLHWTTAITKIETDGIFLRGYPSEELMGRVSFAEVVHLLLVGERPDPAVGRLIDAMLVASADHGATPQSALAARTVATAGAPLTAAMAAGLLAISTYHGGAIEGCMCLLQTTVQRWHETSDDRDTVAATLVAEYRARGERLPGYGHRIHQRDPRTERLLALAGELELASEHVAAARSIEKALGEAVGRRLILNLDGAMAALLADIKFPVGLANALFMIGRLAGIAAHAYEEQARQRPNRRIHPTDHGYDGPDVRHVR
jgi:citrate synthase